MDVKLLVGGALVAAGLSTAISGSALAHGVSPDPHAPCINCQPGPGGPGGSPQDNQFPPGYPGVRMPGGSVIVPPSGGGPKTGGRSVAQPGAHATPQAN